MDQYSRYQLHPFPTKIGLRLVRKNSNYFSKVKFCEKYCFDPFWPESVQWGTWILTRTIEFLLLCFPLLSIHHFEIKWSMLNGCSAKGHNKFLWTHKWWNGLSFLFVCLFVWWDWRVGPMAVTRWISIKTV